MYTKAMSSLQHRAKVFAALGDPRRLEIVEELSRSDRTPGELIEKFEIGSALLAHHLDLLEDAGLIERLESHADRRKRFIRLIDRDLPYLSPFVAPPNVIFVCRQNSARSQLAAAIWRSIVGGQVESAGTKPATQVHPLTLKVASRHQLDLTTAKPRTFKPNDARGKTVITVCDQSHDELKTPLSRIHWSMPDPAELGTVTAFERTFHELVERIKPLVK
ncbi:MAG: ArsR family transcriptional regulator [Actinobacteria bacterium]|nr:ArsR family transcriptional regulator [Actinomycetota bacterium]